MFQILRRNPTAFWWSLGLHLILALLVLVGVEWLVPPGSPITRQPVVEAHILGTKAIEAQVEQLRREAAEQEAQDLTQGQEAKGEGRPPSGPGRRLRHGPSKRRHSRRLRDVRPWPPRLCAKPRLRPWRNSRRRRSVGLPRRPWPRSRPASGPRRRRQRPSGRQN